MSGTLTIRELVTRLGFDIDDDKLDKFEQKVGHVKVGLLALTGVAAATAAGLFALAKSAANAGDEIAKSAPLVGLSVENFQRYRYAADLAGVANEGFATSMQYLARNTGEAAAGTGAAVDAFKRLGVTQAMLKKGDTDAILRQISVGLQGIPNATDRASLSMDIFGRSGLRMGQFLALGVEELDKIGAEAEAFGLFNDDSAKAAEGFADAISRLLFVFEGIKNEIGIGLFPVIQDLTDGMREYLLTNREVIKQRITRFVEIMTRAVQVAARAIGWLLRMVTGLAKSFGGLEGVLKIVGIGLAAAFGATVVGAITALIGIVKVLGVAFLVAWAKALLPAVAIGAAIGLIILAVEDLYTWIKGGNSVLGDLLGPWVEFKERALGELGDFLEGAGVIVNAIKQIFGGLWDAMAGSFGVMLAIWNGDADAFVKNLKRWALGLATALLKAPLELVAGIVQTVMTGLVLLARGAFKIIAELVKAAIPPSLTKLLSWAADKGGQAREGIGSLLGGLKDMVPGLSPTGAGGPAPALAGFPGGGGVPFSLARPSVVNGGTKVENHYSIPIDASVTVPAGTPPEQVAFIEGRMHEIAENVLGGQLRHVLQSNPRRE